MGDEAITGDKSAGESLFQADLSGFNGGKVDGFITYKRRKYARPCSDGNLIEDGGVSGSADLLSGQAVKDPCDMLLEHSADEEDVHAENGLDHRILMNCANDVSFKHWKNVMESILRLPHVTESGIRSIIQDALASAQGKDAHRRCEDGKEVSSQLAKESNGCSGCQGFAREHERVISDGSQKDQGGEANGHSFNRFCRSVFRDVIGSEKFVSFCNLLCEHFKGIKADSVFNFSLINSRMSSGLYEHAPELFASDIEQVLGCKNGGSEQGTELKFVQLLDLYLDFPSQVKQDVLIFAVIICKSDGHMSVLCCGDSSSSSSSKPRSNDVGAFVEHVQTILGTRVANEEMDALAKLRVSKNCWIAVSPNLTGFLHILNEEWTKFGKIGEQMIHLAKSISDIAQSSSQKQEIVRVDAEQNRSLDLETSNQLLSYHSDLNTKLERTATCSLYKVCSCRKCGAEAEGRRSLICDGCEAMYHMSCIEPAIEEIPISWFCAACLTDGKVLLESESTQVQTAIPHAKSGIHEMCKDTDIQIWKNDKEMTRKSKDLDGTPDCQMKPDRLQVSRGSASTQLCKLCKMGEEEGKKMLVCENTNCPYKYYHNRCLSQKQLACPFSCWYCPSCLCRACRFDRDDDKIVLCDGCDEAYHIYCMVPPRTSIPRGNWFCLFCTAVIWERQKMRMGGERQKKHNIRRENGASRSVDMLLSAAEKLNFEEKSDVVRKNKYR